MDYELKVFLGKIFHNDVNVVQRFKRARTQLRNYNKLYDVYTSEYN